MSQRLKTHLFLRWLEKKSEEKMSQKKCHSLVYVKKSQEKVTVFIYITKMYGYEWVLSMVKLKEKIACRGSDKDLFNLL